MSWILVMWLLSADGSVREHSISGLPSYEACLALGEKETLRLRRVDLVPGILYKCKEAA